MASRKYNFTTKVCDKLTGPAPGSSAKEIEYTDMATSLKLMVSKNRKTWYYRYTINSIKRVIRIGIFPGISVDEGVRLPSNMQRWSIVASIRNRSGT